MRGRLVNLLHSLVLFVCVCVCVCVCSGVCVCVFVARAAHVIAFTQIFLDLPFAKYLYGNSHEKKIILNSVSLYKPKRKYVQSERNMHSRMVGINLGNNPRDVDCTNQNISFTEVRTGYCVHGLPKQTIFFESVPASASK